MRVIATGRLRQRSYQDREGQQRTAIELEVDEIGQSLRYATAQVTRAARAEGGQQQRPAASAPVEEHWAPSEPSAEWTGFGDDTPF